MRVGGESEKTYLLGFDSLLHLVRANAGFATTHVRTVLTEGLTRGVREAAAATFEDALRNDMTKPLVDDLANEIVRRLQALAKNEGEPGIEPREAEKKVALTALAAIRAIPIESNLFLKDAHRLLQRLQELGAHGRGAVHPADLAEPTDRWALEEYEKYLMERRHSHRAARVRRFLAEVRKEALERPEIKA